MQGTPYSFFVQWHLTERCNLKCRHCYQGAVVAELSFDEICRAVENIKGAIVSWEAEYGMEMSPSFHFTGGEPFLREDLFAVIEYVRQSGFPVSLMSNGTLINEVIARRLKQAGVDDVQVSLDGLETVHDSIRGKDTFKRALRGIRFLISQGIDTSVNLTLSRLNMGELDGLVSLAGETGIGAVTFSRLVICGRGEGLSGEMLSLGELDSIYRNLHKQEGNHEVEILSRDPLYTVSGFEGDVPQADFPVGGCAAGVFGVTIAADGGIMPCRRMDMTIGNIKEVSFRELWAESTVLWSLRERRSYHGGCESCRFWAICRGCRAVALAYSRASGGEDFLGPDPQCPYKG